MSRLARAAAVLVLMVMALVAGACNALTDFGNYVAGGTFCSSFTDMRTGSRFSTTASFYGCNIPGPDGPLPYPSTVGNSPIPVCGAGFCATSTGDAEAQALAQLGYPSGTMVSDLQCFLLGYDLATANQVGNGLLASWPPSLCVSPATDGGACDPCDDGQGDTLQGPGEHCGDSSMCCAGLLCVGASASIMGTCQGTLQCPQPPPNWQPLTTTQLKWIAAQNNIGVGLPLLQQSQKIGLAFEAWVLTTLGVVPSPPGPGKNTTSFMSMARQKKTGGLPASVIPEFVGDQTYTVAGMSATFTNSVYYEVKAVTGALTPGTSNWQILGLLDVANTFPTKPAGTHPPPAVFFVTTGNTTVSTTGTTAVPGVVAQATAWGVAVWQQQVLYDANGGSNPNLTLGPPVCLTPTLCSMSSAAPVAVPTNPGPPISPLTSPTTPASTLLVPGDPDPPEVD